MKYYLSLTITIFILFGVSNAIGQSLPKFKIMTEPWIPYQFEDENGDIKGIAADLLVLMLERVNSSQGRNDIKMYPWVRGYLNVQKQKNTILFSTTRTKERENMFKWVGPIFQNTTQLIAKKDSIIEITTPKDLHKYKMGTVIGDVGEQYLQRYGFTLEQMQRNNKSSYNITKLKLGRIDLVVQSWEGFASEAKAIGLNPDNFKGVFTVNTADICYAFHKETPDWIIHKFQTALNELKSEGALDKLMNKYQSTKKQ